ncbi:hypothetical protein LZZ85_03155 [Terrimonas sp. NA20]|uniref:Uncharacterized protein n=1 Tax=Terrimonas ginsenosidimutans TaxID=2908004 RepID=A0ABS9KLR4_9BACT|nr:hypothetical protein [Terrimonas ginsenosidimutans]MCG2613256.1 hypothetical protein [Terrimonas ginsenosidimutans]
MAISRNPLKLVGRFDFITLYKVGEQIRMRVRSPLSRKRVLKSPEFKNTRMYAGRMARASKIGSKVYQDLPKEFRQFWMYRAFVGEAMTMLKEGQLKDEEVFNVLWNMYAALWHNKPVVEERQQVPVMEVKETRVNSGVQLFIRWKAKELAPVCRTCDDFFVLKYFTPEMRAP